MTCGKCGAPQPAEHDSDACHRCGAPLPSGVRVSTPILVVAVVLLAAFFIAMQLLTEGQLADP